MKYIAILGNITFNHFTDEELKLFKSESEKKCLIHDVSGILIDADKGNLQRECDDSNAMSYVIIGVYKGEIIFEDKELETRINKCAELMHV